MVPSPRFNALGPVNHRHRILHSRTESTRPGGPEVQRPRPIVLLLSSSLLLAHFSASASQSQPASSARLRICVLPLFHLEPQIRPNLALSSHPATDRLINSVVRFRPHLLSAPYSSVHSHPLPQRLVATLVRSVTCPERSFVILCSASRFPSSNSLRRFLHPSSTSTSRLRLSHTRNRPRVI